MASYLHITINGEDKSGKGIRESEKLLADYLPELNSNLIKNSIIIGQGMPCKFSSYTPSGRKEILEKLSKSDFMIDDLKQRIADRQKVLSDNSRACQDELLKIETQFGIFDSQKIDIEKQINDLQNISFDEDIKNCKEKLKKYQEDIKALDLIVNQLTVDKDKTSVALEDLKNKKQTELNEELTAYNDSKTKLIEEKSKYTSKKDVLQTEVTKLKSIKDVCPTCGQKIPGVVKKDTSKQEAEINELLKTIKGFDDQINAMPLQHNKYVEDINKAFNDDLTKLTSQFNDLSTNLNTNSIQLNNLKIEQIRASDELANLEKQKSDYVKNLKALQDKLDEYKKKLSNLETDKINKTKEKETIQSHIEVVNKMNTLIKRDFRGYLLQNVIKYIDSKAKEYCQVVFGTQDLNIYLDGNALDITYYGKMIENLSGGEQQRVDLIIQFAIRDMMVNYLNFSCNIIALDEIFDNLDSLACDKILNLISTKLNDIESIFIISHHSDSLDIPCDTELHIIKDAYGISSIS